METKTCKRCQQAKPLSEFKKINSKDGRNRECKDCLKKWHPRKDISDLTYDMVFFNHQELLQLYFK
jgi:hypothetical protein